MHRIRDCAVPNPNLYICNITPKLKTQGKVIHHGAGRELELEAQNTYQYIVGPLTPHVKCTHGLSIVWLPESVMATLMPAGENLGGINP